MAEVSRQGGGRARPARRSRPRGFCADRGARDAAVREGKVVDVPRGDAARGQRRRAVLSRRKHRVEPRREYERVSVRSF